MALQCLCDLGEIKERSSVQNKEKQSSLRGEVYEISSSAEVRATVDHKKANTWD